MVDIPRIKFFVQRRYRANWPFLDGHYLTFRRLYLIYNLFSLHNSILREILSKEAGLQHNRRYIASRQRLRKNKDFVILML
jgi:hypothetical protein